MTIIVTGGARFIGSNFIFHMLDKYPDYRIVCLDKLTYAGNLSTLAPVMDHPKFRFVKADICDREAVYQYHFPEKLIPLMIVNALADKPLPVYGEGLNVRDWLYVEDHCRAIDLIIHKGRVGEVYNVGGHNEMRNIDIVKMICKELGWLPETKFEDGIKKTIQWYLEHRDWWEKIINGEYQEYYQKMYGER